MDKSFITALASPHNRLFLDVCMDNSETSPRHSPGMTLAAQDAASASLSGLTVQQQPGPAPDYAPDLYRLYLTEHELAIRLNNQPHLLAPDHLLTLSPGETVQFSPNACIRSLSFHHDFFCVRVQRDEVYCDGIIFNRLSGAPVVAFPPQERPILHARFDEMAQILCQAGHLTRERAINALRALLLHAADFKMRSAAQGLAAGSSPKRLSPLSLSFQHLVEDNFALHKDASFYSDALGVSLVTLNRRIKEELGQSVTQIVHERLAIAARAQLRTGQKSIKEVAFDLGFDDPLYFSRFFRKYFGSAPSQYFQTPTAATRSAS